jgi:molecular chaperone GrpE
LRRVADPSIRELADKVDDLSVLVARQSGTLGQLADATRRPGTDLALLVDLHALRGDALTAAGATRSAKERTAFQAIAAGLERLLAGRGGVLVVPRTGHPFSAATMEAAEEVACEDASLDRTVAVVLAPGLEADGRMVRRARVAVHRYAAQPVVPEPEPAPEDVPVPEQNGHTRVNGRKAGRPRRVAGADAGADAPEPTRPARPAARARQPQPAGNGDEAGNGTGPTTAQDAAPARKGPAKRTTRTQSARNRQPTSAATSSEA